MLFICIAAYERISIDTNRSRGKFEEEYPGDDDPSFDGNPEFGGKVARRITRINSKISTKENSDDSGRPTPVSSSFVWTGSKRPIKIANNVFRSFFFIIIIRPSSDFGISRARQITKPFPSVAFREYCYCCTRVSKNTCVLVHPIKNDDERLFPTRHRHFFFPYIDALFVRIRCTCARRRVPFSHVPNDTRRSYGFGEAAVSNVFLIFQKTILILFVNVTAEICLSARRRRRVTCERFGSVRATRSSRRVLRSSGTSSKTISFSRSVRKHTYRRRE